MGPSQIGPCVQTLHRNESQAILMKWPKDSMPDVEPSQRRDTVHWCRQILKAVRPRRVRPAFYASPSLDQDHLEFGSPTTAGSSAHQDQCHQESALATC